jgi:hypothetical protein
MSPTGSMTQPGICKGACESLCQVFVDDTNRKSNHTLQLRSRALQIVSPSSTIRFIPPSIVMSVPTLSIEAERGGMILGR